MTPIRIVYFGTPLFAASLLDFLLDAGVLVVGIVTQPDRPKGRSLEVTYSKVKELALQKNKEIPIFQPEKCSNPLFQEELKKLKPDLFVVVAFGQILPQSLLDIPPLGAINVHASLLPKYRGAAPIQRAILNGDDETGIAIQKMVRELDAGDVIATAKVKIPLNMTYGELEKDLCEEAKPLLLLVIHAYQNGVPKATPQDSTRVTFAPKINIEEAEINWEMPAEKIHNLVRGFSPKPGAWCFVHIGNEKKRVKILETEVVDISIPVGSLSPLGCIIGCSCKSLKINKIQTEGKKALSGEEWLRGHPTVIFKTSK